MSQPEYCSNHENMCLIAKQTYYLHVIRFCQSSVLKIYDSIAKGILKPAGFLQQPCHGRSLYYGAPLDLQQSRHRGKALRVHTISIYHRGNFSHILHKSEMGMIIPLAHCQHLKITV